jgi:hypothetical protein
MEVNEKMTEIKKITKIVLVWYGVAGLLFAFMYLVITDFYFYTIVQWPYYDPVGLWISGGNMLVIGITAFLAIFKKEWEEVKLFFLFTMLYLVYMIAMNFVAIAILNFPETPLMTMITNIILLTINLVLGIVCWLKQRS